MKKYEHGIGEYVVEEVVKILGITMEEYGKLIYEAGIESRKNNPHYKAEYPKLSEYWDCFVHQVNFLNMRMIIEQYYFKAINIEENPLNDVAVYYRHITQNFTIPKRNLSIIDKQYRLQFQKTASKTTIKQRRTRTPKKQINQLEINLNSI